VVLSVPSSDIRAVGISMSPVVPKSEALTGAEERKKIKKRINLCID
jgi:hypothetical protein